MKEKISKIDKNFYTDIFIKTSFQNEFEAGGVIPLIAKNQVSTISNKNKKFYSLAHSSHTTLFKPELKNSYLKIYL